MAQGFLNAKYEYGISDFLIDCFQTVFFTAEPKVEPLRTCSCSNYSLSDSPSILDRCTCGNISLFCLKIALTVVQLWASIRHQPLPDFTQRKLISASWHAIDCIMKLSASTIVQHALIISDNSSDRSLTHLLHISQFSFTSLTHRIHILYLLAIDSQSHRYCHPHCISH